MENARVRVDISNKMAVIIRENWRIMLLMDMGNILIKMDSNMKGNGNIICRMVGDRPIIKIKVDIMGSFLITKGMVRVC